MKTVLNHFFSDKDSFIDKTGGHFAGQREKKASEDKLPNVGHPPEWRTLDTYGSTRARIQAP